MKHDTCHVRVATAQDIGAMRSMQADALRRIGTPYYPTPTIERALIEVGTLERATVDEGHYFAVQDPDQNIIGTGGWSQRAPEHRADPGKTPLARDTAIVRSIFVDPEHARRGIGKCIMRHIEQDAVAHGIRVLKLTATLSGTALYRSVGYQPVEQKHLVLSDGTSFESLEMMKVLDI